MRSLPGISPVEVADLNQTLAANTEKMRAAFIKESAPGVGNSVSRVIH